MIIARNNNPNTVTVTTQEKVVGTPTYYVFKLNNDLTKEEILFIPSGDLPYGPWPERANNFDFSLGRVNFDTQLIDDRVNGFLPNLELGQWNYEIYSETGTVPTTNPVTLGTWARLCESGRLQIK